VNCSALAILSDLRRASSESSAAPSRRTAPGDGPDSRPPPSSGPNEPEGNDDEDVSVDLTALLQLPTEEPEQEPTDDQPASPSAGFLPDLALDEDDEGDDDNDVAFTDGIEIQLPDNEDDSDEPSTLDIGFVPEVDDAPDVSDAGEHGPMDRFALETELPPLDQDGDDEPSTAVQASAPRGKSLSIALGPSYTAMFTIAGDWQAMSDGSAGIWVAGSHLDHIDESGNTRRITELGFTANELAIAADGSWALVASAAGKLLRVDLPTGTSQRLLPLPGAVSARLFQDATSTWVFDSRVGLHCVDASGKVFTPAPLGVEALDVSQGSGEFLLYRNASGSLGIEKRQTPQLESAPRVADASPPLQLFSAAGQLLLVSDDGLLSYFDAEGTCRHRVELSHQVLSATLAAGPATVCWLALRQRDGAVSVVEFSTLLGRARIVHTDDRVLEQDDECRLLFSQRTQRLYLLAAGRLTALEPDRELQATS